MIDPSFCQVMARYNTWQNQSLMAAADMLSDDERRLDRGAFFGSISATLNHLLWGDTNWLHRLAGTEKPQASGIGGSIEETADWDTYRQRRAAKDQDFRNWADGVSQATLDGDLRWYSSLIGEDVVRPYGMMVVHVFNHQTHHRGQVHAMLTAAGAKPEDTDLMVMPEAFAAPS